MSLWHLVIKGRIVRSCDAPDRWAAEARLGPLGQVISDASWQVRQERPRESRRCACGRESLPDRRMCNACKDAQRRTNRRADVNA